MPLDPRIPMGVRTPDLLQAVSGGLEIGRRMREQPMREALMREQIQNAQFNREQQLAHNSFNQQKLQLENDLAQQRLLLKQQQAQQTSDIKNYALAKSQGYDGSFLDYQQELRRSSATKIENNISNSAGRQTPTKSVQSEIQKNVLSAEKSLNDLGKVADTHSDEFLTTMGRFKAGIGSVLDKMDSDAGGLAQFNANRTRFANAARQFFNQYRKEITGAAASVQEMEALMKSMFNEGQGPREFKASFDLFMEKAKENLHLARENAREGIDVSPLEQGESLTDDELFKKYGIE